MDELDRLKSMGEGLGTFPPESKQSVRARLGPALAAPSAIVERARFQRPRTRMPLLVASLATVAATVVVVALVWPIGSPDSGIGSPDSEARGQTAFTHSPPNGSSDGNVPAGPNPYPPDALLDPNTPLFGGGYRVSLEEAHDLVGFPIYRPEMAVEPQVWAYDFTQDSGPSHDVGLRYDSSLAILYVAFETDADAQGTYKRQARDWGVGYVDTIEGNPAWIVPREENSLDAETSVVHVAIDGVDVELHGRMSADDLVTLARTLHA